MISPRVRAPELTGGPWFGTEAPLSLAALRGRWVLLDFWTSCCGNCLHVLDELRGLEDRLADVLTIVGVHSPKFRHEAQPETVAAAIARNEVTHPVLSDPQLRLWQQYAVKAWPTLVLVDPEGYVIASAAGEGQAEALAAIIEQRTPDYESRGALRRGPGPSASLTHAPGTLSYPAKAIRLPAARTGRSADTLLVADAGHHQLVELALDGITELRRIGSGRRSGAGFAEPNGLALLPPGHTAWDVAVADTANHVLRAVELRSGTVVATLDLPKGLAGATTVTGPIPAVLSPWDVAWWPALDRLVVAAAGVHLLLAVSPATGATEVLAGTTVEGLRDGPARDAWLAQPSGLAVDGERLWFVDAESSSLRYLTLDRQVHTAVGEGLFDFGHVDGTAEKARLQHPLGVALLPDGTVAVADTYNGAIRRYDPATRLVSTLADGLAEPSGLLLADGDLRAVESAAHRLTVVDTDPHTVAGFAMATSRPVTAVAPGRLRLTVPFTPAPGRKLDDRYGPATTLSVTASPPDLLVDGGGSTDALTRDLLLAAAGEGVLQVVAQAASCDVGGEHPACHLARQDWGIPITITPGAATELELPLLG
jgi:thiol-disulfide isomerase/thioredoxin